VLIIVKQNIVMSFIFVDTYFRGSRKNCIFLDS